MKSLQELYRVGLGPSSSHTMGPHNAAVQWKREHPEAVSFRSPSTDLSAPPARDILPTRQFSTPWNHQKRIFSWIPEALPDIPTACSSKPWTARETLRMWEWLFSVGGGAVKTLEEMHHPQRDPGETYELSSMKELLEWREKDGKSPLEICGGMRGGLLVGVPPGNMAGHEGEHHRGLTSQEAIPGPSSGAQGLPNLPTGKND